MPGAVGHSTELTEHSKRVATRLVPNANLVGKKNVIAGTDCGLEPRASHNEIAWAELETLATAQRSRRTGAGISAS